MIKKSNRDQEKEQENLKPVFGVDDGIPPFYDPDDRHCHIWISGKLGRVENHKLPKFSNSKIIIRDCEYCKICHEVKNNIELNVNNKLDNIQEVNIQKEKEKEREKRRIAFSDLNQEKMGKIEISIINQSSKREYINKSKLFHKEVKYDKWIKFIEN